MEQVNSKEGPDWKLWEQPDDHESRELLAFRAAEAARHQGKELFERFHLALLKARHEERLRINDPEVLIEVARKVGLDLGQFEEDLKDKELIKILARDHTEAVEKYGVFGTPTFVFENGGAGYLKTYIPPEEESVKVFEHLMSLLHDSLYFGELKRPQPPWPKGIFTP